jgi:hypothetical protein
MHMIGPAPSCAMVHTKNSNLELQEDGFRRGPSRPQRCQISLKFFCFVVSVCLSSGLAIKKG